MQQHGSKPMGAKVLFYFFLVSFFFSDIPSVKMNRSQMQYSHQLTGKCPTFLQQRDSLLKEVTINAFNNQTLH